MGAKIRRIIIIINSICLIFIILLAPLSFYLFSFGNFKSLYLKNGVYEKFSDEDLEQITVNLIEFFKNNEELEKIDPAGDIPPFTSSEISHLEDVRKLTNILMAVFYSSVILFILFSILQLRKKIREFLKNFSIPLIYSSSIVIFLLIILLILSNLNFWEFFDDFHKIFFPQGNYMFSPDSLIISLFPLGFFYDYFLKLAITSAILSIIILILGIIFFYYGKGRNECAEKSI